MKANEIDTFYVEILKSSQLSGKFESSISSTISMFAIEISCNTFDHTTFLVYRAFSGCKRTFIPLCLFALENATYNMLA